jgi:hypothetical protein
MLAPVPLPPRGKLQGHAPGGLLLGKGRGLAPEEGLRPGVEVGAPPRRPLGRLVVGPARLLEDPLHLLLGEDQPGDQLSFQVRHHLAGQVAIFVGFSSTAQSGSMSR